MIYKSPDLGDSYSLRFFNTPLFLMVVCKELFVAVDQLKQRLFLRVHCFPYLLNANRFENRIYRVRVKARLELGKQLSRHRRNIDHARHRQ